ncbi:MAG: AAA domain-containing protein [Lachnospiraceae bacterium]|nr:AAA domain-containing protein [Lachnospiraceae bacterium]
MNPVIIAAGVCLSAKVISFIAGELTEAEKQKQKEIAKEIERIQSLYCDDIDDEAVIDEIKKREKVAQKRNEIHLFLKSKAEEIKVDRENLIKEISDSKNKVVKALNETDYSTPLRRSSLELLTRQLDESKEKARAYIQYLDYFISEIPNNKDAEKESFSLPFMLPENYPYVGKVIWINPGQLSQRVVVYEPSELPRFTLSVDDDRDTIEYMECTALPVMITGMSRSQLTVSIERGLFKAYELVNTRLGVSAVVNEIQNNKVVLIYQNKLELCLHKDKMINPNRFPPVRSQITVYPIRWEYRLSPYKTRDGGIIRYPVTVSEKKEDAISALSFRNFPICFEREDFEKFTDYFQKNSLQDYDEEFLIGPACLDDVILKKGTLLKLQIGDIPLFYVEVDEYSNREDILRYYFRFHHMCDKNDKVFSADDIFVPFDVSIAPYYAGTSDEMIQQYMDIDNLDDVVSLIWDVFEEFRIQNQIRKDRQGIGYFLKWEYVTGKLISVLEQGDSIELCVNWRNSERRNTAIADIKNFEDVATFIQNFEKRMSSSSINEWKPQFFVKDYLDNRYEAKFGDSSASELIINGMNVADTFENSEGRILLYIANRPYAEYQQKNALRQLRVGQVVNPIIQATCLNSLNFISDFDDEIEIEQFFNKCLKNNQAQKQAVINAFKEKNLFLIQGPPGTGKTTVIRELVEQTLNTNPNSRVLIVSQANVAVDNALSGLVERYANQVVRCGRGNKISSKFQEYLLQTRCKKYIDNLKERKIDFDGVFYDEWENIVIKDESHDYSPALCELIVRSHRLIGATCVGLAKRNIGLERMKFDLVIIDEAGKALPAELLIPLVRAKKAVIIGDQRQLPPIINPILYDEEKIDLEERTISENILFSHSFFERLYDNAPETAKIMLNIQYRMPAVIGTAISELFYDGKLMNGEGTDKRIPILYDSNLSFLNFDNDKQYFEETRGSKQVVNKKEAGAVVFLLEKIRKKDKDCKIAVVTPYKGQKRLISNTLLENGIYYKRDNIEVDTIDSFQGSEAEVVLFCTTRAQKPTRFFRDNKRLNVALSRAKRELIILGKMSYFTKYKRSDSCLPKLAEYIKKHGNIIDSGEISIVKSNNTKEMGYVMVSVADIIIPIEFYKNPPNNFDIQDKIEEYYKNGDFLQPISVKRKGEKYILDDGFSQFGAIQELGISEVFCRRVRK